ncbi:MAG: BrnT family toxin [Ignavibacteriales bacterium]|nr:BrnT family toxin [Ignavibacteriales bacterium]
MQLLENISGFEWEKANKDKIWRTHRVAWWECEEAFLNVPMFVFPDVKHSQKEERYHSLGRTNASRLLFMVFTVRQAHIRVISARNRSKKERKVYLEKAQEATKA